MNRSHSRESRLCRTFPHGSSLNRILLSTIETTTPKLMITCLADVTSVHP